jgi:hypothetical protein
MNADHIPPRLRRAFERMQDPGPVPAWPRSVRLGIDYSLRVGIADISTDADADSFAWNCVMLGQLQQRDPPGDPPATCTALEQAERAGPEHARAFHLLGAIRDNSTTLAASGMAVRALPERAMRLLQTAARAEPVPEPVLLEVLDAAQALADQLGFAVLRRFPTGEA